MSTLPKFLAQITVPTGGWTFAASDTGGAFTASVPAADYDTILELCAALETAINAAATDSFSVAVSSGGIVTITADATWTVTLASWSADLKSTLGYSAETVSSRVLTATLRHLYGFYSPVGAQYDPDRRVVHARYEDQESGGLTQYASSASHRYREVTLSLLSLAQTSEGGTDDDGLGSSISWSDRTLLDFWEHVSARPFRFYADRSDGTVASPGTEGDEYVTCRRRDNEFAPSRVDPDSWAYWEVTLDLKVVGESTVTATASLVYWLPLDYVRDWPAEYASSLVLDWQDGDGTAPSVGPTLTTRGAPTAAQSTPWRDGALAALTCSSFDGSDDGYTSGTSIDPAAGDDCVVVALVQGPPTLPSGFRTVVANRVTDAGWRLGSSDTSSGTWRFTVEGTSLSINLTTALGWSAWSLLIAVIDADGNTVLYQNGASAASAATPAHTVLGTGLGVGIGCTPSNTLWDDVHIHRVQVYTGTNLAASWTADYVETFAAKVLGTFPATGTETPSYTRASAASWDVDGVHYLASSGMPRAGAADGMIVEEARTNLCYRNWNPSATTGWTATGGTLTTTSDASALATAGLSCWGPNVFSIANSTGSDVYVHGGATTGSTDSHALSIWYRMSSGSSACYMGLWDVSGSSYANKSTLTNTATWTRAIEIAIAPTDTDQKFAIKVPTGTTLLFIAQQLELGENPTTPIPNASTAASVTRAADVLTYSWQHTDTTGEVRAEVTPEGWSEWTGTHRIVTRATTDWGGLAIGTDGYTLECSDGTNTADCSISLSDGVTETASTRWSGTTIEVESSSTSGTDTYDGAFAGSGDTELGACNARLANVEHYDRATET